MKLLVHSAMRRRGIGRMLMLHLEKEARSLGRNVLTLDTQIGEPSELLYASLGYTRVGEIPRYVRDATGAYYGTVFYYKHLGK